MGTIRQTKRSCNSRWTDVLFRNRQTDGPNPGKAITLVLNDPPTSPTYKLQANTLVWFKFVAPRDYNGYDLAISGDGMDVAPIQLTDYTMYQSDASTVIDTSTGQLWQGTDWIFGAPFCNFFTGNFLFISGETYYISFVPPLTGKFSLVIIED
jgi:hypothetical protein